MRVALAMMTDPGSVPEDAIPVALKHAPKEELNRYTSIDSTIDCHACMYVCVVMHVVCLCMEAVLFGLFTMCMMCDQYSVITTGTTQIDRLKGETSENLGVREVFGGTSNNLAMHWFFPDQLLGYALEELTVENDPTDVLLMSGEMDVFLPHGDTVLTEKLQGGWSVEKHVLPKEDIHVV
ncbi:hypothetical protein DYB25_002543 [Aphanomyces astaci]|uniref:Uncharacterized protein n=2 Tax=Aphanomyces astaci TaxID=112090 RepID=A0A397ATK7_APHAT|nr:hypothetical protein DYB25_002543 [Aphanomyces astaci]RHY43608.1 hypothetical protein DYB34_003480 [Aphanomyces astaci]RHY67767.1 hypothetical protein DYB30_003347 [Aphanomyces astaci]RHY74921.1 hypothetical protein DYB38_002113 [Aphanomyces astaci]RHY78882.1 hypothetical protein DYB31_006792 [Aphanomyces astaci]